jgi:alpha-D-ribose 1-methylphosphonate 5-triphosphate diphosphatase
MSTLMIDGTTAPSAGWPAGQAPLDYVLGHVRAVLADRVLDDARVVVRDGLIAAVEPHPAGSRADLDGKGLLCLPGLIDVHSDALERERVPRPSASLPWDFALLSLEAKLRAAGITTVFHGACFQDKTSRGLERSIGMAAEVCAAVRARRDAPVDHRILYRLDVRSAPGAEALRQELDARDGGGAVLVSHEDHTPGQGQYTDRTQMEKFLVGADGLDEEQARRHVDALILERAGQLPDLARNLDWLGDLARAGRIRLMGHDPDSRAAVQALVARGGSVAEFPTSLEAARAARELGLPVVMGAPNALRGTSHSGNASARALIEHGLVTALASDYLPSGLLAAVFALARAGAADLPTTIGLVTSGAARVAGLDDRGALAPGLRADLTVVDPAGDWPVVWNVLRSAR